MSNMLIAPSKFHSEQDKLSTKTLETRTHMLTPSNHRHQPYNNNREHMLKLWSMWTAFS